MQGDGCFEVLDGRFERLFVSTAKLDTLYTGCRWSEGPAYFPAGRYLVWSDIPNDRMLRYDECDGSVAVFRHSSNHSNGNTTDRAGRLVTCEHGGRRISRTEVDGRVITLADSYRGKRLNSPNDVVEKSDGSLWFTDPTYGIDSDYEGHKSEVEQAGNFVYRLDPRSGDLKVVADDFVQPNGIAFSPDERLLYIVDTGASHVKNGPRHIRVFDVGEDGIALKGGKVFATCPVGMFDGMRVDVHGNIWTSSGEGVLCYGPDGKLLGKVLIPEVVANVEFGGPKRNRLYICGTTSLYAIYVNAQGASWPK